MSVTLQDMQNALSTLGMTLESSPEIRQLAEKVRAEGGTAVPGTGESVRELFSRLGLDSLLPELPAPRKPFRRRRAEHGRAFSGDPAGRRGF